MTNKEALNILKCKSKHEVDDVIDELLFEFKSKFLQQIPPLKIIEATISKLKRLLSAYSFIKKIDCTIENISFESVDLKRDLNHFLADYQQVLSSLKLKISQATTPHLLINSLNNLVELQQNLFLKLSKYHNLSETEIDKIPVKLSAQINVFNIQNQLKHHNIDQNEISEYIRTQIKTEPFNSLSELTLGVVNAQKQLVFNGIRR